MGKTSIKELSKLTGFSATTVSMVLNGSADHYKIAKKTQEMILSVAQEHNYIPNLHARNLRNKISNIIALMIPTLTNRFFSEMAETFEQLARMNDKFHLITVTHHDEEEELKAIDYFITQNADCIFTANPMAQEAVSRRCTEAGVKQVILDAAGGNKNMVTTDNFNAARILTHNLIVAMEKCKATPKGIYYIGGTEKHEVTKLRFQGFLKAIEERERPYLEDLFIPCDFNPEAAHRATKDLFAAQEDIGGLFINSLQAMEGVIRFFTEDLDKLPRVHLGVFDYHPFIQILDLNIISVMQDANQMMQMAFELYSNTAANGDQGKAYYSPYKIICSQKAREV
ncbi:MAG: LacI family DNA-binding transcriptional regulator [Desulfobacterales bacterium]